MPIQAIFHLINAHPDTCVSMITSPQLHIDHAQAREDQGFTKALQHCMQTEHRK